MSITLDPYFIGKVTDLRNKGYSLEDILIEYNNRNGIFNDEIIAAYYHINNGPDLRPYQIETLEEAKQSLLEHKNFKLFWCCGLGKTKMALSISKNIGAKTILLGVPNILLLDQFANEIKYFYPLSTIFKLYSKKDLTDVNKKGPRVSDLDLKE